MQRISKGIPKAYLGKAIIITFNLDPYWKHRISGPILDPQNKNQTLRFNWNSRVLIYMICWQGYSRVALDVEGTGGGGMEKGKERRRLGEKKKGRENKSENSL